MNKITTMGIAEPGILLVAAGGEIDIPNGESTNTITINSAKDSPPILNVAQASANNPYPSKIVIGEINGNHITTNDFEGAAIENRAIGFNTQERKVVAGGIIINGDMQNNVISNKGELYAPAIYNHAKNNAYIIYKGGFNGNTISSMIFPDYRDIENSQILNVAEHDSYISFTKLPVSNARIQVANAITLTMLELFKLIHNNNKRLRWHTNDYHFMKGAKFKQWMNKVINKKKLLRL